MEFSIVELLANFTDDKLIAPKVLEKKLGCDDETSFQKLQIALDALAKVGVLEKDRGRYRRIFEDIQRSNYQVFHQRITLSTTRRVFIALRVWLRSRFL